MDDMMEMTEEVTFETVDSSTQKGFIRMSDIGKEGKVMKPSSIFPIDIDLTDPTEIYNIFGTLYSQTNR